MEGKIITPNKKSYLLEFLTLIYVGVWSGAIVSFNDRINIAKYPFFSMPYLVTLIGELIFILIFLIFGYYFYKKLKRDEENLNKPKQTKTVKKETSTKWLTILTGLLVLATILLVVVGYLQYQTLNRQSKLLEEVSIPNYADLEIELLTDAPFFWLPCINKEGLFEKEGQTLTLIIQNKGRLDSGGLWMYITNTSGLQAREGIELNKSLLFTQDEIGIKAAESKILELNIRCKGTDRTYDCNKSIIPTGLTTIYLYRSCILCKDREDYLFPYQIYIYENDSQECIDFF